MTLVFNKKETKNIRRELRKQNIGCERIMWSKLRNNQLGYKFRRQYGIDRYVVDFYCPNLELVVEIDGATHSTKEEIEYDKFRQEYLESHKLKVKRYTNIDVRENLEDVLTDLQQTCKSLSFARRGPG